MAWRPRAVLERHIGVGVDDRRFRQISHLGSLDRAKADWDNAFEHGRIIIGQGRYFEL